MDVHDCDPLCPCPDGQAARRIARPVSLDQHRAVDPMESEAPTVSTSITEWMVTALPIDHPAAHSWAVWVQAWLGEPGRFIVSRGRGTPGASETLTADGRWTWDRTRHDQETALRLAAGAAPNVQWNGRTAADILRLYPQ